MIFSLLVLGSPVETPSSLAAFRFAQAALAAGHRLHRVFFFGAGVCNSDPDALPAGGEPDLPALWGALAGAHGVDLVSCVGSARRRGILDAREAARRGHAGVTIVAGFELSGLGQLVDACLESDRVLTFGDRA